MNLQRLKFAQARGARIQILDIDKRWCWIFARFDDGDREYRIRPGDEHLQYGPISQGLIDWALYGYDTENHPEIDAAEAYFNWRLVIEGLQDPRHWPIPRVSVEDWAMFRLFMAELLADEGL